MNARQHSLLSMLFKLHKIKIERLSEDLRVCQGTIRNDILALEREGWVKRFRGGGTIASNDSIAQKLCFNFDVKSLIARRAASLVCDGETVMLESGSTNALFAVNLRLRKMYPL